MGFSFTEDITESSWSRLERDRQTNRQTDKKGRERERTRESSRPSSSSSFLLPLPPLPSPLLSPPPSSFLPPTPSSCFVTLPSSHWDLMASQLEPSGANWKEPPFPRGRSSEVQAVAAATGRKAVGRMRLLEETWKLPGWVSTQQENFQEKKIIHVLCHWSGLGQQFDLPSPLLDQIISYEVNIIPLQPSLSL